MQRYLITGAIVIAVCAALSQGAAAAEPRTPARTTTAADTRPAEREPEVEAAERALERSLVRTGVLLLPAGLAEVEPAFVYQRHERSTPVFFTEGGQQFIANDVVRTSTLDASLLLRVGLPRDTQLELGLPYRYVEEKQAIEVGGAIRTASGGNTSGAGDARIGVAKTLFRGRGAQSSLVGRITWDTGTGDDDAGAVSLGRFGSNEVEFSLSGTNRQDPLVVIGNLFYRRGLDDPAINPGDQLGLSVGALLAASPDTSLRVVLDQTYEKALTQNGVTVQGSDTVITALLFGASSNIGVGKFLDVWVQVGLTDTAPDYTFGVAYAVRFNAPWSR
jgi:hypothetical protein